MRIAVLAFFFILGSTLGAFAQQGIEISAPESHLAGRDLLNFCHGKYDVDAGYCAGYMTAVAELLLDHPLYRMTACEHGKVRSQQLTEIYMEHLQKYPPRADVPASMAAVEAVALAFPCRS
ncbi:MAG: hypothetical protein EOM26_06510 [Alphaproteobacteria bacterium]|nr:hypothetical protein [Alphaproteobacteria bacterium]